MKQYGHVISKLRKKQGLTQEQLGKKLNVSYQAISKWENNLSEPDLGTIERLTEVFGISMSEFFDMAKNPEDIGNNVIVKEDKNINESKNFIKTKPWYLVAGLGVLIVILSFCAFLIPVKYSSSKIYEMVDPSVFCITAEGPSTKQAGSGFFINDTGLAVTNYHVIQNCTSGQVQLNDGKTYNVKSVVGCDEDKDIAIIQIDIKKSKGVKLGNSNKIEVGEIVYAIGYPESFQLGSVDSTFTQGIISKTSYDYKGNTYIQTTVDMTRGNSGGVLVNQQGQVIGITTLMITNGLVDYMNMAIPINKIQDVKRNINETLSEYYEKHKTFCFYSDGVVIERQDFVSGDKIKKIENPTKIGYSFGGWYTTTDFDTLFDFNTPVVDQIACYAKWIPNKYTIRFDANGGEGTMNDVVATYDEELTLPSNLFQLKHYNFKGWEQQDKEITFKNSDVVKNLTTENNGLIVLNALWEMQRYTISFNGNNSDAGSMENITLKYDQKINLPSNQFSRTGYLFNGWTYNGQTYKDSQEVSKLCEDEGVVELLADWKPITYTVRFTYENNSYEQNFTYDKSEKLLPNAFNKEYFNFTSWFCSATQDFYNDEEEILNLTTTQGQIFTFVAQFSEYTYSIRYNPEQEIDLENCELITYRYSEERETPGSLFSKTGYKFVHWIDDEGNIYENKYVVDNGVGTWVGTLIYKLCAIDKDIINFYAIWEEITYKAYYKYELKNETKYTEIGIKTYEEEFVLIAPEYVDDGYEFTNWEVYSKTYSQNEKVSRLTWTNNSTVYILAKYQPKQYLVNFDGNGETSGEMLPISATFDQEVTIPENAFVKEGYTFVGWNFNGKLYTTTNIGVPITTYVENITLTAYWVENLKGEGTIENPYSISTLDEMNNFADLSIIDTFKNKYIVLSNDIDCKFSKLKPINFAGNFDGKSYKLFNVDYSSNALFSVNEGIIVNLGIDNLKIERVYENNSNTETIAGLVHTNKGTINKCYVNGSITITNQADIYVGGLVYADNNYNANKRTIEYCYTDLVVTVSATTDISNCYVCGLIVNTGSNEIKYCYTLTNINVNVQNVEKLYVNAFARSGKKEATFAKTNIHVSAISSTTYSFKQNVQYYTDDSEVVVTINEQNITDLITQTTQTENLQNQEWNENNCFNVVGVWSYTEGEFPKPNDGTKTITINSKEEFLQLNNKVLKNNYILNCDIDLTDISFKILENYGVFDGNGHIISNFKMTKAENDNLYGLFGINYNTIKNIGLSDLNIVLSIEGDNTIGGLVAINNGIINSCFVKGNINVSHSGYSCYIGGIAGVSYNLISNCYVDAEIVGTNNNAICVGGICASGDSRINNCYTKGNCKSTIIKNAATCAAYGITTSSTATVSKCFSLANIEITSAHSWTEYCRAGFISEKFTDSYSYIGQVRTRNLWNSTHVDYPESGAKSLSSLCSKTLLQSLQFQEFTTQENLTNNENAVWVISGTDLPKLWFEK